MAAKIARGIVTERTRGPIQTTRQLARIVAGAKGSREKIDPATRVFQALRIEVNQELAALSRFLKSAVERLAIEGRIAMLAYHSLEDRAVKETFRRESAGCLCPPGMPVCVCGGRRGARLHPATRVFQALRIAVNAELEELEHGLAAAERVLKAGGRLAVVSFHSLEDRMVKTFLAERAGRVGGGSRHAPPLAKGAPPSFELIFNGARGPSEAEAAANPRARSAKLRAAIRTAAPAWRAAA